MKQTKETNINKFYRLEDELTEILLKLKNSEMPIRTRIASLYQFRKLIQFIIKDLNELSKNEKE